VTFLRKLLVLAAGLPALVAAADPGVMSLVMPDATMVMEVNIAKIISSPMGSAMGEAFQKGVTAQLKTGLPKSPSQLQEQIAQLTNIDWSRDVQDIVIASGTGKQAATLLIVRTSLNPSRLQALKGFTGAVSESDGVPMLVSSKAGAGVFAFLDNSIVLIGQMDDVKAAIHRRGQHPALPAFLSSQVAKYALYDFWMAAEGPLPAPPMTGPAAGNPAAAQAAQYLEKIAAFNGGFRFSPDFEISADVEARTQAAAAEMSSGLRWLTTAVQAQAKKAGKNGSGLEGLKYQVNGKHILVSLHVPEEQMRAGLKQMRAYQASQAVIPPAAHGPLPPAGSISVQSSEGTVLIPLDKEKDQ
jgi:hypothetical protein